MKTYWDSSALIAAILNDGSAQSRFQSERSKVTRVHALAETYSQLTGGRLGFRADPHETAEKIAAYARQMTVLPQSESETIEALLEAPKRGAYGGAIHDFLHVFAAEKQKCERVLVIDKDFSSFTDLELEEP